MAAIDPSLYESIIIEAADGSQSVDVKLGVTNLLYYEDLFSPTITAVMEVVNTGGTIEGEGGKFMSIYSGLPLRGGERVFIKVKGNNETNPGLDFSSPETALYVSSIKAVIRDSRREVFTIALTTRESITNETSRIHQKYKKQPPEDIVKNIVKTYLRSNKAVIVSQFKSKFKYGFIGNFKKPFTTLVWLASKGKPSFDSGGGLAGYFFYETVRGYHFIPIDELISEGIKRVKQNGNAYDYESKEVQTYGENTDRNILNFSVSKNNDLLRKMRYGMYSSFHVEFDPATMSFTPLSKGTFSMVNQILEYGDLRTLGTTPELPKIVNDEGVNISEMPSRIFSSVKDSGVIESGGISPEDNAKPSEFQRESLLRYNLLFNQVVNMTVPSNTNLAVGDCLNIHLVNTSEGADYDREQSGLYMIKELCHSFDASRSLTTLKLVRDTYGLYSTN